MLVRFPLKFALLAWTTSALALALPPKPTKTLATSARRLFVAPQRRPAAAAGGDAGATAAAVAAAATSADGAATALVGVRGGGGLKGAFAAYDAQMVKRPIITKMWTSFIIGAFGDMLSQLLSKTTGGGVDAYRMVPYGLSQLLYFGPVMHFWFQAVDGFGKLPVLAGSSSVVKTLAMTAFDQTVGATLVISGFFMFFTVWSAVLAGTFFSTGLPALLATGAAKVGADLWPTLVANWKLWPAANFLNFKFVPLDYRVLFTNIVAIIWNIYLSAMVRS